ncbi:MAG TPA: Crp/Fnr family transcriptional regulator [Anaeromyxobacteraceae bacterium]|nr:Crp/Fnr family transcriptional regulator [Anaeromyxobacteraceae bacterium]
MGAEDQLFQRFGREFRRGTVLFREGEPGREMYVIQVGRVDISKRVGGVEKLLTTLGHGEFFGEMSILNNAPRSATATCSEDSKLLVIDPKTFEAMIRGNTEIALRMIKKLADRLQEADHQIENLLMRDAGSRVVHWLLLQAEKAARGGGAARVETTAPALAARVGVKPEQADDILMKLLRGKIVAVHPDAIVVPDVAKLRQFLEFLQMKAQFGDLA